MPYSEKEIADFWASIDKAADDAAPSPYSYSKVKELIRVCWALKKENAELRAENRGLQASNIGWIKRGNDSIESADDQRTVIDGLVEALDKMLSRFGMHSGSCCTFDELGDVVVTKESCCCEPIVKQANAALKAAEKRGDVK